MKRYKHITLKKRVIIQHLLDNGTSCKKIAETLMKSPSTISEKSNVTDISSNHPTLTFPLQISVSAALGTLTSAITVIRKTVKTNVNIYTLPKGHKRTMRSL